MDQTVKFFTDTATLAVFDPRQLEHRVDDAVEWWCLDFSALDEVQSGSIALVSLGSDGVYQVRVTDEELLPHERDYAAEVVSNLGSKVESGKLFIGPGECLAGGGSLFDKSDAERGVLCDFDSGDYQVDIYAIYWYDSPLWWTDGSGTSEDAPADFVVVLRPRTEPMPRLVKEPRFDGVSNCFLFESHTRQIGPQPGMILTTKVRKGPDGLCLKGCGPKFYAATLRDYSQVEWKDTVRFKVIAVDHEHKMLTGEFIKKVLSN